MRKLLIACFLVTSALSAFAASSTSAATAAGGAPATPAITLTPDQARQALDVLNDPQRRAQIEDTLRAVVAAGALSAVPASAPAGASAAEPASGAAEALQRNGLASQLARQGAHWLANVGSALHRSVAALLDVASVRAWWHDELASPQGHAMLGRVAWTLLGALLPALALEWLAGRLLRGASEAAAKRSANNIRKKRESEQEADAHVLAVAPAEAVSGAPRSVDVKADAARGKQRATLHLSVLRRLPGALLHTLFRLIPLVVFVIVASALMSVLSDDGTPAGRALDALIDLYVVCRGAVIISHLFLQPDAPALRLWRMGDQWAALTHRWVVWIAVVIGVGTAVAEVAARLGMNDDAHLAIMKAVALATHVMVSILILQCRRPVAARIRERSAALPSLAFIGNWLADVWAGLAVFVVMALWFVWALDVRNGYQALLHLGGISIAVLVAARVVSIVVFGALGRVFNDEEEEDERSIAQQHAYRYYPLLRRVISTLLVIVTVLVLLQVWGLNLWQLFHPGTIGHRLASALVTIAIAAVVALFVWEAVNASVEQRLALWTSDGDFVRAARLRTLLPMLRTALFVVIALVVVLTGLSELGVNTAPLLAGASIFGVALGFGSQKLVQDFITGIFLLMENAMQVGDWVTLAGVSGTVEYLSIRTVRLRGGDGSLYTVPFSSVSTVNNTNRGLGNAAVKVSVAYGQDVDLAIATLKEIGASLRNDDNFKNGILSDFAFWGVDAVDGASVTLTGQIQCRDTARWGVQREFNRRVLELFQQRGIEIANPQRSVLVRGAGSLTDAGGSQEPTPAKQPGAQVPAQEATQAGAEQQLPQETQKAKGARAR